MVLSCLGMASRIWAWFLWLVAAYGHHRRAAARVAIRHEGQAALFAYHGEPLMWFHVSSLGELEQAIPVMQEFRRQQPDVPWLLTVYSPSAWHPLQVTQPPSWRKGDVMAVLPDDHPTIWKKWFSGLPIRALALAKYDLWPNMLMACRAQGIPIHAYAVAPRGGRLKLASLWGLCSTISVQDAKAARLFQSEKLKPLVTVDGDPRIERVLNREVTTDEMLTQWSQSATSLVVAGSTWPAEERRLLSFEWTGHRKLLLVPHDLSHAHLQQVDKQWEDVAIRHSNWQSLEPSEQARWHAVIIDSTGLLFSLYRLADVAVIGGGFGSGLHNVLEPASAGIPIVTGPKLFAFREAEALKDLGSLRNDDFEQALMHWLDEPESAQEFGRKARKWLESQHGASSRVVQRWSEV